MVYNFTSNSVLGTMLMFFNNILLWPSLNWSETSEVVVALKKEKRRTYEDKKYRS